MNKCSNILTFFILIGVISGIKPSGLLYVQNDTPKQIGVILNNTIGYSHSIKPGMGSFIETQSLKSLYAKYEDGTVSRKLNMGNSIEATKEGMSSVIHIIPGTLYGLKVGYIQKGYDLPLEGRIKIQKLFGVTLQNVEVPELSKTVAAKILGIDVSSTEQEAREGYLKRLSKWRELENPSEKDYLKYLLNKALSVFKS